MTKHFSLTIFIIAIVSTAVGTCLVSLLACWLVTRRHRAKQQAHDEEKEVNDALDRAIVSYIVKELPSPHGSRTTQPPEPTAATEGPQLPEPAMTTAFQPEPPTPTGDQRQPLRRISSVGSTDPYTPRSGRRTASSHFMDSSERVYADILARPLEHVRAWSEPRVSVPVPAPAPRDDVGWPLTSRERGWV
ncbi:hypothetical protein C8A05DRAFT_14509 [Staphylotrichum tortipilum]|uniref:Transmembrane protein n=1 Tax=Staphylotrichum tortipilum TaxID=2831512 RepID=A0AAN6MNJ1_9PEZI|nr:hypothetical protein C8A05DRAFT_14509 [Staphylotrichum longicolle]